MQSSRLYSAVWRLAEACIEPVIVAIYHVETVRTGTDDDGTVITRILAFCAGALKVDATYTACIV